MSDLIMKLCPDHQSEVLRVAVTGSQCPCCLTAPSYNALTIDLAHANAKLEAAESENKYLKAQLTQCRGAGVELELAGVKMELRNGKCAWCGGTHEA